ncbi:hypothetical protein EVAR_102972_1 [Eumeta japonica]|uniref:Uncharacterized protein n=1 Tax=Eumeta variegata TaxID=151549 RepID=A0A4C1UPZ4_EUMVA|nr:hypothetical protein EVAR_102972_1 [Eumeta japonica]
METRNPNVISSVAGLLGSNGIQYDERREWAKESLAHRTGTQQRKLLLCNCILRPGSEWKHDTMRSKVEHEDLRSESKAGPNRPEDVKIILGIRSHMRLTLSKVASSDISIVALYSAQRHCVNAKILIYQRPPPKRGGTSKGIFAVKRRHSDDSIGTRLRRPHSMNSSKNNLTSN